MTPAEWGALVGSVTDRMIEHTNGFVAPLSTEDAEKVRLLGSASIICGAARRYLLTCEHVVDTVPVHFHFSGSEDIIDSGAAWLKEPHPVDAAIIEIDPRKWNAVGHAANGIAAERFAERHQIADPAEILFFRGFAGENAAFAFDVLNTSSTGYSSQQKADSGDDDIFELFWEPAETVFTPGTSIAAKRSVRAESAHGFSGSLVWNTRWVETTSGGREWSPGDAVVTGLLRRWDQKTRTLLVWRVEHLVRWLSAQIPGWPGETSGRFAGHEFI